LKKKESRSTARVRRKANNYFQIKNEAILWKNQIKRKLSLDLLL